MALLAATNEKTALDGSQEDNVQPAAENLHGTEAD
jgi:hypothetical protein